MDHGGCGENAVFDASEILLASKKGSKQTIFSQILADPDTKYGSPAVHKDKDTSSITDNVKIQETNTLHKRQVRRSPKFLTEDRTKKWVQLGSIYVSNVYSVHEGKYFRN
jgi:hypothetical protein